MTTFIAIGSPEHEARLAWRDRRGYRDAQRYSRTGVEAIVQEHRIEAEQRHNVAIEAGGYDDPFEGMTDVLDTDPAVVGYDKIATVLLAAEHLIETHTATGIDLSIFGGVSDLVDWALDYCGVAFDADAAPKGAYI